MPKVATNDKIYELVDMTRRELKSDIIRVETKFDSLEAGRLTRLEERVSKGEVIQAVSGTKLALLITGITSLVSAIVTVLVNRIL